MDYSYLLSNYILNEQKLKDFGFSKNENSFFYSQNLKDESLLVQIQISENKINVKVIDSEFNDDYLPFYVKKKDNPIKDEVENLLQNILSSCFDCSDVKEQIIKYTNEKYGTIYESPWEGYPQHLTFKTNKSKKWYAIIMAIKQNKLGLVGENVVSIMNVKLPPEKIQSITDNKHFFPAYHMNKKYWLTILLDKDVPISTVKNLIDESYNIVEKV